MRLYLSFILVSVFLVNVEGTLPDIGDCSFIEYKNMTRECFSAFYKGFQKDPKANCSTNFVGLKDCMKKVVRSCARNLSEEITNSIISSTLNETIICDNTGLKLPGEDPVQFEVLFTPSCNSSYLPKIVSCIDPFRRMWRANKGDPMLCSEYAKVKECTQSLLNQQCSLSGVAREIAEVSLDNYNPFCASNSDPIIKPPTTPTVLTTITSNCNTGTKSLHLGIYVFTAAVVILSTK